MFLLLLTCNDILYANYEYLVLLLLNHDRICIISILGSISLIKSYVVLKMSDLSRDLGTALLKETVF